MGDIIARAMANSALDRSDVKEFLGRRRSEKILLFDFEPAESWNAGVDDLVNFRSGTRSRKLTAAAEATALMEKTASYNFNGYFHQLWMYVDNYANLKRVEVMFSIGDTTFTKYIRYFRDNIATTEGCHGIYTGWCMLPFCVQDCQFFGGAVISDMSDVQKVRLRITASAAGEANVSFDHWEIAKSTNRRGQIMFSWDDYGTTIFSKVYPILNKYRYPATFYVITDGIGVAGRVTETELKHLHDAGWVIGSHTANHVKLLTADEATIIAELKRSQQWLAQRGLSGRHFAFPFGALSATAIDYVKKFYSTAACSRDNYYANPLGAYYIMPRKFLSWYNLTQAKAIIDNVYQYKLLVHFAGHSLDGAEWTSADFTALIDYIYGYGLDVITPDDLENNYQHAMSARFAYKADQQSHEDIEFLSDAKGIILVDRTTATRYRLLVDNGVLDIEAL